MLKGKEAVIFDLDGTLIDSMWVWHEIDIKYLGGLGYDMPDDLHANIEGKSFYETAVYFKERFNIPDSIEAIMQVWSDMAFQTYVEEVDMKPGALSFVKRLRKAGFKTAIATSNSTRLVEQVLKAHDVLEDFDAIVTADEVQNGKPDPEIYLTAASRIQVSPEKCLVFEDVCNGILAGKRAGMEVCAVRDSFTDYQWDEKLELADYSMEHYDEIVIGER